MLKYYVVYYIIRNEGKVFLIFCSFINNKIIGF